MAKQGSAAKAAKSTKRPAQIVVTMETSLKKAVHAKAKAANQPVTEVCRELFQKYVAGEITLEAAQAASGTDTVAAPPATTTSETEQAAASA